MLKKANIQWSGKTLANQIKNGMVLFDCAVQRNPCWDVSRKSLLIHSMVEGYPIPPFYFARRSDKKYDALDGLQRSTAIREFLNEEYALSADTPPIRDEEGYSIDIVGKKFSELPEWAQDNIKDYSLTIYYFEDITEDEISELFFRINNGKSLTSIELTRVKAKCLKQFQEIASHGLIAESVTEAGKKRYTDENIAMQAWMLCFSDVKDFSTKVFRPCIETADVTEEHLQKIKDAMDSVKDVCSSLDPENKADKRVLKKIRTRSHLVSSIYLAMRFIEEGRKQEEFMEVLYKFFDCAKTSVSEAYNNSVGGSSARPEKIRERMVALDALLKKGEKDGEELGKD